LHGFRLHGPLNSANLRQAFRLLASTQPLLRARFSHFQGQLRLLTDLSSSEMEFFDLRDLDREECTEELEWLMQDYLNQPFDMARGPLLRGYCFLLSAQESVALFVTHDSLFNARCGNLLMRELLTLYINHADQGTVLADTAVVLCGDAMLPDHEVGFSELFHDLPDIPKLPIDRTRIAGHTLPGTRIRQSIAAPQTHVLRRLAQDCQVSLEAVLLALCHVLLYGYSGESDLLIAMPLFGRKGSAITSPMIGPQERLGLLRNRADGNGDFRVLLEAMQTQFDALCSRPLPDSEQVREELRQRYQRELPCLLSFDYQQAPQGLSGGGIDVEPMDIDGCQVQFDWEFTVTDLGDQGLQVALAYSPELYSAASLEVVLGHWLALLESACDDVNQRVSALLQAIKRPCAAQSAASAQAAPFTRADLGQTLYQRFSQIVRTHSRQLALKDGQEALTYAELDTRVGQVAAAILHQAPVSCQRLAILLDQGIDAITAVLAALRAGITYVPLDVHYPQHRIELILADAEVGAILTDLAHLPMALGLVGDAIPIIRMDGESPLWPSTPPPPPCSPDAAAYIIYTSGSSGRPKGVVQSHRNVLHAIRAYSNMLLIGHGDHCSMLPSYSVDAGVMDLFGALLNGATLYPLNLRQRNLQELSHWLAEESISIYHSTPTVFRYFIASLAPGQMCPSVRALVLGGEMVNRADFTAFKGHFDASALFINLYGATEASFTLKQVMHRHSPAPRSLIPAGVPVEDVQVILLDETDGEAPIIGEIAIAAPFIALGYWRQPELSARVFPLDERSGRRIYRTGDLGRWLADGSLEVLGRRDFQVKIRGYRVELGEIEQTLAQHPQISKCAVVPRQSPDGDNQLLAFCVATDREKPPAEAELRRHLQRDLPDFMLPALFLLRAELPMTATRKIDRKALMQAAQEMAWS
jgi:amino acid adenylation domain-containing protein